MQKFLRNHLLFFRITLARSGHLRNTNQNPMSHFVRYFFHDKMKQTYLKYIQLDLLSIHHSSFIHFLNNQIIELSLMNFICSKVIINLKILELIFELGIMRYGLKGRKDSIRQMQTHLLHYILLLVNRLFNGG